MEDGSGSSIWQRIARVFNNKHADTVEQAIREASEEGELDKEEGSMLLSVLALDDLKVQDIMTPRTDITCIAENATINEVLDVIISSGHSRIPVYKENRDNVIGIIHAKDIIPLLLSRETKTHPVSSIMREPYFIPETKRVLDLLQEFRLRKSHLAVTLDEYGGTAGLVSIEDVLEQIVGDIEDEHDTPRIEDILQQDDGSYIIAGRTFLTDLNAKFNLAIESDEVETIGGYISLLCGRVPKVEEEFPVGKALFCIRNADAKQIHTIQVFFPQPNSVSEDT